jgi:hypothetical protein
MWTSHLDVNRKKTKKVQLTQVSLPLAPLTLCKVTSILAYYFV